MNKQEINQILDELGAKAERDIEVVFARSLKSILAHMLEGHRKFGKNGQATWIDVNKYNRFNQEIKLIAQQLNAVYKEVIKLIQASLERLYIERYLLIAYLLQQSTGEEMVIQTWQYELSKLWDERGRKLSLLLVQRVVELDHK
ncbi:MAG TPA: hypothetical protein DCW76_17500 [Lysinibacillus sp.]|nr:hypothetical protein [Lysinibacillus sp.]